jgi:hypothetical protein
MPIPLVTGDQDFRTGIVYPKNTGTWANLKSTREITLSSNVQGTTSNVSVIVGNVSFGNLTIRNTNYYANSNIIILGTTTSNIANISVGMKVYGANIGSNVSVTSIRNSSTGITWDSLTAWITQPAPYFIWNSDIINNESSIVFNCLVNSEVVGNVSYTILTTDGAFDGNDIVTTINVGNTDIPAYQGQYVLVSANVRTTGSLHNLSSMDINITNDPLIITRNHLYTGNLSGTSSSRQLDLGRNVSYITSLQMTPYLLNTTTGEYVTNGYVASDYFPATTGVTGGFPQIVDKLNGGANIALVDNDGNYSDGYIDLLAYVLPEQYMDVDYNIKQR